jgi:predicted PurR-regulated permease PerM
MTVGAGNGATEIFRRMLHGTTRPDPELDACKDEKEALQARKVIADAHFRASDIALVTLAWLAVLYTLYFAADIILPFVLALVLGLLMSPAARFMNRKLHFPRMLAALVLIAALFSTIGAVGYAISVPATNWIAKAPQSLPTLQQKLSFLRQPIEMFQGGMAQMQKLMHQGGQGGGQTQPQGQTVTVQQGSGVGMSVLTGTRAFLGQTLTLLVLLFFILADGDSLLRRFVEILPGLEEKKRAVQIATQIEHNISGYLATITMMNLLVGTANGLSIWAFGLPSPLLWGTVAFLLNYVPILGPLTGVAVFFFVGLFTYSNVFWALAPAGVYLLIHIAEGETITPMLLARRFTLNPLLVIASLMFWDWLWGITGALLAVPLLAVTKIMCDHIEVLTPIGHLLGAERTHPHKGEHGKAA